MWRIDEITGLRAVAVGMVLLDHSAPHFPSGPIGTTLRLFSNGTLGVDIFFVLSGFLITTLLIRERATTDRADFAAFY